MLVYISRLLKLDIYIFVIVNLKKDGNLDFNYI